MKIVGLTGGIGSGKTTVAKLFAEYGVPVYYSDAEAKNLMRTSPTLIKAIKELLGKEAYIHNDLNKPFIAQQIFNNKEILSKLNSLVHPAVRKDFISWYKKQQSAYVIQESAILFEMNTQDFYDKIILVTAPKEIRVERVLLRDKSDRASILARINNQLSDAEKIPLADYIIENNSLEETYKNVLIINKSLSYKR